jgi:hypothetical protein
MRSSLAVVLVTMSRAKWYISTTSITLPIPVTPTALANHGFIIRNCRDMTIPHLLKGLAEGLNMGADFTVAIGGADLSSPDPLSGSFDVSDLNQHNFPIEHDANMSR